MPEKLFDVIAVNQKTRKIQFMAGAKTERNAEAIEKMAIMRRGLEEDFYLIVPEGTYKDGDTYRQKGA